MKQKRCPWAESSPAMRKHHDEEWGVPSHEDRYLFEMLVLEGAQAGLSWATILNRRDGYRRAFAAFDPVKVVKLDDRRLERLLEEAECPAPGAPGRDPGRRRAPPLLRSSVRGLCRRPA